MLNFSTTGFVFSFLTGAGFGLHHSLPGGTISSTVGPTVVLLVRERVVLVTLTVTVVLGVVGLAVVVGFSS